LPEVVAEDLATLATMEVLAVELVVRPEQIRGLKVWAQLRSLVARGVQELMDKEALALLVKVELVEE